MSDGSGRAETGAGTPERVSPEQGAKLGAVGRGMLREAAQRPGTTESSPALAMIEAFRTGVNPKTGEDLKDVGLGGGKLLMTPKGFALEVDGAMTTDRLCVAGIAERVKMDDGSDGYVVTFAPVGAGGAGEVLTKKVTGEDGTETKVPITGKVSALDMIDMQAAAEAAELSKLFSGDARDAFDAYTGSRSEGPDFMPPDNIDDLIKNAADEYGIDLRDPNAENESIKNARERIQLEITKLKGRLDKDQLSDTEKKLLVSLGTVETTHNGEMYDAFALDALHYIQSSLKAPTGDDKAEFDKLQELINDLEENSKADIARETFTDLLKSNSESLSKKWEGDDKKPGLKDKPGGMAEMLKDPEFRKLLSEAKGSQLCEAVFGEDLTGEALQKLMDKTLTKDQQEKLKEEYGDKLSWWKIVSYIVAGIIVVPVAAAVGTTYTLGNMAGVLSKQQ